MTFLSSLLSFFTSKTGIILIFVLAIAGSSALAVNKYKNMQAEITLLSTEKKQLETNKLILEQTIKNKDQEINDIVKDYEIIKGKHESISSYVADLEGDKKRLLDLFEKLKPDGSQRDLGALAAAKSKMIEKIINKGTSDAFRCVEIASGTKANPTETNRVCPVILTNNK